MHLTLVRQGFPQLLCLAPLTEDSRARLYQQQTPAWRGVGMGSQETGFPNWMCKKRPPSPLFGRGRTRGRKDEGECAPVFLVFYFPALKDSLFEK